MEYENKEAKKLFRWFLLCSVIILVLSATVAMFAVRSYRVKENEAVTAMLGIVLKNDGSDTEESRQEKISESTFPGSSSSLFKSSLSYT